MARRRGQPVSLNSSNPLPPTFQTYMSSHRAAGSGLSEFVDAKCPAERLECWESGHAEGQFRTRIVKSIIRGSKYLTYF